MARANGEGSVYRRADGRYVAALSYADPDTGKRSRVVFYGKTSTEARRKLRDAKARLDQGSAVRDSAMTVAAWSAIWREAGLVASSRKETTKALSATLLRTHIEPSVMGRVALDKLRPSHIDGFVLELRAKGLAPSSVQRIYDVLRALLDDAVRDRLLASNPARVVKQPRRERTEARYLSADEVNRLLAAAEGTRLHPLLVLIASTGLRKGEALALRWADVDLVAGVLAVRGTLARVGGQLVVTSPKTAKSRRMLPLTPTMLAMLKSHRAAQAVERLAAANVWAEGDFIFTTETGRPVDPRNALRAVTVAAAKAGLEGVAVHSLRHSAVVTLLQAGVNVRAVSDLMGHADSRVTLDVYAHLTTDTARAAMDALGSAYA
jgi:integrase